MLGGQQLTNAEAEEDEGELEEEGTAGSFLEQCFMDIELHELDLNFLPQ